MKKSHIELIEHLALLCATEQQSYSHDVGVCRPSVCPSSIRQIAAEAPDTVLVVVVVVV